MKSTLQRSRQCVQVLWKKKKGQVVDRNQGKHRNKLIELLSTNCFLVTVIHCCVERIYKVALVIVNGRIGITSTETFQFYHHYCIIKIFIIAMVTPGH